MEQVILNYVEEHSANGIFQHSPGWKKAKGKTIGGSEISILEGTSPYSTEASLIASKTGVVDRSRDKFSVYMHWGNLFEDVFQKYLEHRFNTTIYGNNIFILGPEGSHTSYSPDGIGMYKGKIALFEFKCPFTRIPNGKVPQYYVSQVKYGLDIIPITTIGVYAEAVFRMCNWKDMGLNNKCDNTLAPKSTGNLPLAQGIIGFYSIEVESKKYGKEFDIGTCMNNFAMNDISYASRELFEELMALCDCGTISLWYSELVIEKSDIESIRALNKQYNSYCQFLKDAQQVNYGILPWKLFSVDVHEIQPEIGYIAGLQEKINGVINIINKINDSESPEERSTLYTEYLCSGQSEITFAQI